MDELRDDQRVRLVRHVEQAFDRLALASSAYRGELHLRDYPEGVALLAAPREELVSVAVASAASAIEMRRVQQERADASGIIKLAWPDVFPIRVVQALGRRHLPFEPEDVELLLDLGTSTMRPADVWNRSFETLSFGVSAAARLLRAAPGCPPVVASLDRSGRALDRLEHVHTSIAAGPLRQRIHALLAASAPGGLLDLSVLDERNAWAASAAETLRRHADAWERTQDVVALLARATSPRPTKAWRRTSAELAADYEGYEGLLRTLLEPLLTIDLSPSETGWPPMWLLAPANEVLARGATWASADVDAPWVVPLLGRLALRCAAPSPHPRVTTALSYAVASGAVEALAAIATDDARAELRTLLGEVRRRDLLKRIATLVGEAPGDMTIRDEQIRREKRRAVQRKANPEPKERQRLASAFVRRELGPVLREAGFDDSAGRTFWRTLDDRIERVHCKVHAGGVTLEVGIWFSFVPRSYSVPGEGGRARPGEYACDLRGHLHAWHDDLPSAMAKAEAWFARWRPLPVVLHWLQSGGASDDALHWGAPGSPIHGNLVGYLARELGDDALARECLTRVALFYEENTPPETTAEWDAWLARVREDAGL